MRYTPAKIFCLLLASACIPNVFADQNAVQAELDAFWSEVARTVREGDFDAYRRTYHPDAVLVSGPNGASEPITDSFVRWESGFAETREQGMKVDLDFRFVARLNSPTTAHETGLFRYAATDRDGNKEITFFHFQALLIKRKNWKTMMEYQVGLATEAEWNAAGE
ncbi:YybH family protein [Elongatibacter sediminis]|uniref:DUF4440 domain-containing protein n=1 Tax=Elongatibacter sediminis TaxID=3119006 RepID=A0AAW9RAJ9_9GAMM